MASAEEEGVVPRVISNEEYLQIPEDIRTKLLTYTRELSEQTSISTALLSSTKFGYEQKVGALETELAQSREEHRDDKRALDVTKQELEELQITAQDTQAQLSKLQQNVERLEAETTQFRQQRDGAVSERDDYLSTVERRTRELERLQEDHRSVLAQLQAAVTAKCLALSQIDAVEAKEFSLDFKEKQWERERELLNGQVRSLTDDLNNHSTQIMNLRRENTARTITLETQLTQKTEELKITTDANESLTKANETLTAKLENLMEKLHEERENQTKLVESFQQEIAAQKKLSALYKKMTEDSSEKSDELENAVEELQTLLKSASEQYEELEKKFSDTQAVHDEMIAKKNDCIGLLKAELSNANELVQAVRRESLEHKLEDLSPAAASASRLIKSGMTLTQIYTQYVAVSEQLIAKTNEVERLDELVKSIVGEIEEKAPALKKQREDFLQALDNVQMLTDQMDKFVSENNVLRAKTNEATGKAEHLARENKRYRTELADLARQVCHLLGELQSARGGYVSPARAARQETDSAAVISQKLVLFSDIEELQAKNQNLLAVVRELSARQEEMERASAEMDPREIMSKLQQYEEDARQMRAEQEQHVKMMGEVIRQRDSYQNLYQSLRDGAATADEGDGVSPRKPSPRAMPSPRTPRALAGAVAEKDLVIRELETKLEASVKAAAEMREEHQSYRVERQTNETLLNEQVEQMRKELREVRTTNGKLAMQAEYSEARFKVQQTNAESAKSQIKALEEKNRVYSDSLLKMEQALSYLKDEAMKAQATASQAEVALTYLRQEHRMLQESEARLAAEREAAHREGRSQALLMSNLDSIKASLERSEVDGRMRMEARLDESAQECCALRRRLVEEQDRFGELRAALERKVEAALRAQTEEQEAAARARADVADVRAQLEARTRKVEELERRVKELLVVPVPSKETKTSAEIMERRLKDLERDYNQSQSRLKTAQQQLAVAQQNAKQYCLISEAAEKQLKDTAAEFAAFKQSTTSRLVELQDFQDKTKAAELLRSQEVTKLSQGLAEKSAEFTADLESTRAQLESKTLDLAQTEKDLEAARATLAEVSEALQQAEAKYAQEVVLHSADIQTLNALKANQSRAADLLAEAANEKEAAVAALRHGKASLDERERQIEAKMAEEKLRVSDLDAQNVLLHNQIEELSSQLAILQSGGRNADVSNRSLNLSNLEDEPKSSDELLQIIKYLRKEKDIAVSQFDVLRLENMRLKAQQEFNAKALEEARKALAEERDHNEVSAVTAAKHAELLRKLDTMNAIMDSNRSLRLERESLMTRVAALGAQVARLETEIAPLKTSGTELQAKMDALESENVALRGEAARLRQRNNFLIERSNKASPEDWRKLQQERENLIRQLGTEKESHQKVVDEVRTLKESAAAAQKQHLDEVKRIRDELAAVNQRLNQTQQELAEAKELAAKRNEQIMKITENLVANEAALAEIRNKEITVRKIAKKYKTQFEELRTASDEDKAKFEEKEKELSTALETAATTAKVIPQEMLDEIREEGRRATETQLEEANVRHLAAIKELTDQALISNETVENLKKEVASLKEGASKGVLMVAKQKIMKFTAENAALKEQLAEAQSRCTTHEQAKEEAAVRMNALKSQYEARIARVEKESAELRNEKQVEKDRLDAEVKTLSQRLNQIQRTLYNAQAQQGKPSTSSGPNDKPPSDPPTANIKPMAGPSSTAPKPPKPAAPNAQTATLTPWTGRGETPFASIRPMSMQPRTVAVMPTSVASQREAGPPAAHQIVHTTGNFHPAQQPQQTGEATALSSSPTSSHTDYMPATSSAAVRQAAVQPLAESAAADVAAQSTQDESRVTDSTRDDDGGEGEQPQVVALVQPRMDSTPSAPVPTQQPAEQSSAGSSQASSSNNAVTTSQTPAAAKPGPSSSSSAGPGLKRFREAPGDSSTAEGEDESVVASPQGKRVRLGPQVTTVTSESGLEVEYQVPTSSQRDQEDEIIMIDSEEEEEPEEDEEDEEMVGECLQIHLEPEFEEGDSGEAGYASYPEDRELAGYEEDEGPDIDADVVADDEDNNEVDVLEDSSDEVPNQSESVGEHVVEHAAADRKSEATSSGPANHSEAAVGISTSQPTPTFSFGRGRTVPPLSRQAQTLLLAPAPYEEAADDSIVPSTPTLFVPRRSDGFAEAVSSPQVPTQARFTFSDPQAHASAAAAQQRFFPEAAAPATRVDNIDDTRVDLSQLDEGTGRSVPTTPLLPMSSVFSGERRDEAPAAEVTPSPRGPSEPAPSPWAAAVPDITVTEPAEPGDDMPPPGLPDVSEEGSGNDAACDAGPEPADEALDLHYDADAGVSSEGEKPPVAPPEMDEGREAVASVPARGIRGGVARRSGGRPGTRARGRTERRTPIVWTEPGSSAASASTTPIVQRAVMAPIRELQQRINLVPSLMQQMPQEMQTFQGGARGYPARGSPRGGGRRPRSGRPPKGFNPYAPGRF